VVGGLRTQRSARYIWRIAPTFGLGAAKTTVVVAALAFALGMPCRQIGRITPKELQGARDDYIEYK
jgi:hypothetical protein